MSRDEGFPVMDLSTSWQDDPKWRSVWRQRPDLVGVSQAVYLALAAASWRDGSRLKVQDAWPPLISYDPEVVHLLMSAKLVDRRGMVVIQAWESWFGVASERREKSRADWRRYQQDRRSKRNTGGVSPDTTLSQPYPPVPSVPTDPNAPPDDGRADLEAYLMVRYRPPTPKQRELMDAYVQTFDVTGPQRAADLILRHPDDPIGALKADLTAFRSQRVAEAQKVERPAPVRRRKASQFTGVNAEIQHFLAAQYAADEITHSHRLGKHAVSVEGCSMCQEVVA